MKQKLYVLVVLQQRPGSTKNTDTIKVEICNKCHPYFTGRTRTVATGGRVDKFKKKFGIE